MFLRQIYGGLVLHRGSMIRSCKGRKSLLNTFPGNLKIVIHNILVSHEGIYTDTALISVQNYEPLHY